MARSDFFFLLFALFPQSFASPWNSNNIVTSTKSASLVTGGISPLPTTAPFLGVRDGNLPPSICGFLNGINSQGVTCSSSSRCAWHTELSYVGCCSTAKSNNCLFYTGCVDGKSPRTGDDPAVYTCRGVELCYRNIYPSSYMQWGCAAPSLATSGVVFSTFNGQPPAAQTVNQYFIGNKELSSTAATVTQERTLTLNTAFSAETSKSSSQADFSSAPPVTSTQSSTGGITTLNLSSPTPTPTEAAVSNSAGPSTTTIIGASVGSIAFGALVVALVALFLVLRRKKNQECTTFSPVSQEQPMHITPELDSPPVGYHSGHPSMAYSKGTFDSPQRGYSTPGQSPNPNGYYGANVSPMIQQGGMMEGPREMDASEAPGIPRVMVRSPTIIAEVDGRSSAIGDKIA